MVENSISSEKGFYIGDIGYALSEEHYDNIWGNKYNYADGIFALENNYFAVYGTSYGDGIYKDKDRKYTFSVDSGVIGIVPKELIDLEKYDKANQFGYITDETVKEIEIDYDFGVFHLILKGNSGIILEEIEIDTEEELSEEIFEEENIEVKEVPEEDQEEISEIDSISKENNLEEDKITKFEDVDNLSLVKEIKSLLDKMDEAIEKILSSEDSSEKDFKNFAEKNKKTDIIREGCPYCIEDQLKNSDEE